MDKFYLFLNACKIVNKKLRIYGRKHSLMVYRKV